MRGKSARPGDCAVHLFAGLRLYAARRPIRAPAVIDDVRRTILRSLSRTCAAGLVAALALAALAGCAPPARTRVAAGPPKAVAEGLSDRVLLTRTAYFEPAIRSLARRHDPGLRRPDLWGRPLGWANLDLRQAPDLGFSTVEGQGAVELNSLRPFAGLPIRPMKPFVLSADDDDRTRALQCMSQAIYYEAAREPLSGQQAVAQVVLNRVRHPAYPKSICGVVYQGAAHATGCQFTFTCDGSLRWTPQPSLWKQVQDVAKRALAGYVDRDVGSATHYHAAYVAPYWAPTLVKMTQVGQHIFYRWTGPWGEPAAFTGHYAGREADLSPELLASYDARTQGMGPREPPGPPPARQITLAVAGEVRTYSVADPAAMMLGPHPGALVASRRQPTADEIRRINESLAAMEKSMDSGKPAAAAPGKP